MSKSATWSIVAIIVVVAAIIAIVLTVPNNKTSTKSSTTTTTSAATKQKEANTKAIEANMKTFFAANTTMQQREALLQNGSQFAQVMQGEFAQLNSQKPSVVINSISYPNSTTAKVNYTVDLNGQPVLKDQSGEALLINNTWKVSDSTLCELLNMGGQAPSICKNIH
jgi:hypothetical protein